MSYNYYRDIISPGNIRLKSEELTVRLPCKYVTTPTSVRFNSSTDWVKSMDEIILHVLCNEHSLPRCGSVWYCKIATVLRSRVPSLSKLTWFP